MNKTKLILLLLFSIHLYADTHQFSFDDDGFADTTEDRHYTGGIFYTWMSENNNTLYDINIMDGVKTNNSISLSYLMFNPTNKRSTLPQYDDLPYAGHAKVSFLLYKSTNDYFHEFGVNVGMVGPSVRAKNVQNGFHSSIGRVKPSGWDTQLKDQPTLGLSYNFAKKYLQTDIKGYKFDLTNNVRADIGNFYSGVLFASAIRIGSKFYDTFSTIGNDIGGYESNLLNYKESESFHWDISLGLFGNKVFNYYIIDEAIKTGYNIPAVSYITGAESSFTVYYKKIAYSLKFKISHLHNNESLPTVYKQWGTINVLWKF